MTAICFYFQVHQPYRLDRYSIFDIGTHKPYFGAAGEVDLNNRRIIEKVAGKCYQPTNELFLELLRRHPEMKIAFSLTGTVLEQLEAYAPAALDSFRALVETGRVEILSETYYHSLAFLRSPAEFRRQIALHAEKVRSIFGVEPAVFRNTELIYNNDLASLVAREGYRGMLAEGADHILGWRQPNFVYRAAGSPLPLLLKNYQLSDDIAFRFGEQNWKEYPLTAEKFARWVNQYHGSAEVINFFMDYETFGEHQWADTGIFDFMDRLPAELYRHPDTRFITPSEAFREFKPVDEIDVPEYISWADVERDLSAWQSNEMQVDALRTLYSLEEPVLASGDPELIKHWRYLTTSDHFYYMCTKWWADGDVHTYFSPYNSPYEAFIAYMNVLHDIQLRLGRPVEQPTPTPAPAVP